MNRAAAWGDTWIGTRRRLAELPYAHAVFTTLLGLLAATESLAEFIAVHGSIPRMFADTASGAAREDNVAGVQFVLIVGLLCLSTALRTQAVIAAYESGLVVPRTRTLEGGGEHEAFGLWTNQ